MINLRFHMVSLVAVFFALAIGIAIGATVVDQGVLNQTERRLSSFDARLQERDRSISALRKELRSEKGLVDQLGPKANVGRLDDRIFVVVALADVPVESIRAASRTLANAGAEVVGTYRLDRTVELRSEREQRKARELLDLPSVAGKGGLAGLRDALDARIAQSFAAPLLAPALVSVVEAGFVDVVGSTKPVTLPSIVETVLLERSVGSSEAGASVEGLSEVEPSASSAIGVPVVPTSPSTLSQRSATKDAPGTANATAVGLRFAMAIRAIDAHKITVALSGNSLDDSVTSAIRTGELREAVSTVDGVETVGGASSLVFALMERPSADAAHFGVLRGARRRIAR
jgi:Copper transport outer membrane protein, MctB